MEMQEVALNIPRPQIVRVTNEYVEEPTNRPRRSEEDDIIVCPPTPPPPPSAPRWWSSREEIFPPVDSGFEYFGSTQGVARPIRTIICKKCKKCQCYTCRHIKVPSIWCFNDDDQDPAPSCVNTVTCMCCVKGAFYHCQSGNEQDWVDNPCACSGEGCCKRWSFLSLMGCLIPCLCCYIPLRLFETCLTKIYWRRQRGCQCQINAATDTNEYD